KGPSRSSLPLGEWCLVQSAWWEDSSAVLSRCSCSCCGTWQPVSRCIDSVHLVKKSSEGERHQWNSIPGKHSFVWEAWLWSSQGLFSRDSCASGGARVNHPPVLRNC